jgi:hypothetical protein
MTTAADDAADEIAFEAFLAGRPVPAEADGSSPAVATFAGAVRATATLPGRPNAALAELLTTGLLTDHSSPSIRTAPSAGRSPRRSRVRRRRRFAMFFPALLAKFLAAGAVAQAASGVGIALVAFTGAGATGMLGDDVQTTLTSVVAPADETTDEVGTPDASPTAGENETPAVETPAVETPAVETPAPAAARAPEQAQASGPIDGQKFGDWVHEAFPDGKADGRIVSKWARLKHVDPSEVEGIEDVQGIDDSTGVTAAPTAEVETETEHSAEATHGNGGGNSGHGGGHGGRGHN